MKKIRFLVIAFFIISINNYLHAEDGYRLWLRYDKISDPVLLTRYQKSITGIFIEDNSPALNVSTDELRNGLSGLLGRDVPILKSVKKDGVIVAGTPENSKVIASLGLGERLSKVNEEGFIIVSSTYKKKKITVIAANTPAGVLYGAYNYLRLLQTYQPLENLNISSAPAVKIRILNHWDNLNGSIERGYAGKSLWEWDKLPDSISPRYADYARANASIGINGTVLTNVNANALVLTPDYLKKVAVIANELRPYNIKVYLTARFSAPIEIGKLKTADPLDPEVVKWWRNKIDEIYTFIPDFGGFVVKANSEGQPGPQQYGRNHADGANMFADALAPHNGIVMWRAFVYDNNVPVDRAKQAYNEFVPLDGNFRDNVLIQVKNGPIDFQPREPFHPLFGAMPKSQIMPELQITQEYLGFSIHLVYLAPLYEECLKSDTYSKGKGSLVAKIIDGTLDNHSLTAMAGVANTGDSPNWTSHPFAQSNWYAFGRLAWNPYLKSEDIADEWLKMTFGDNKQFIETTKKIMLSSREIAVNYMTPLGLHHIMYEGVHYGPGPWVNRGRKDWTSVYYHKADTLGIGFDRTSKGSNATSQYFPEVGKVFDNIETCPEENLLWFHHVSWDYRMKSGRTLWDEMCYRYSLGVDSVKWMKQEWEKSKGLIDDERFNLVSSLLSEQVSNARIWKDACLLYFQQFSRRPFPDFVEKPEHTLDYYMKIKYNENGWVINN
ncbi:MAG TPA: alpha-glucuronidase family glycosyl hydrolase [Bacteroidales bacterium]|nr:alpha-glucuronidase family glycosyl hydrolase [Bacteroidales bacterium]